jgi:DNA-binding response OmpR family regulator
MSLAVVVDDDRILLSLTERWLHDAGYEVETASSFKEGLDLVRSRTPDVLVADIRLGAFNGLNLALLVREARADARLVLISGWDDPVLRKDAASAGARYLLKPFRAADLLDAIQ